MAWTQSKLPSRWEFEVKPHFIKHQVQKWLWLQLLSCVVEAGKGYQLSVIWNT
jgi:hypothetical protein